ncbi:MAG: APC family permease [Dehalobacterium sp.]
MNVQDTVVAAKLENELRRDITWKDAFWLASGVALGAFTTIGGVASITGKVCWVVFIVSVIMGFSQSLTYAEIAGLFPNKSGGASVYGAMAWIRYNQFVAPLSTWCNWFAWSPVLSVVSGLAASYVIALFPTDSWIRTWQITLLDLNWLMDGLRVRISATWFFAVFFLCLIFSLQHFGVAKAAKIQRIVSRVALIVVFGICLYPILSGRIPMTNVLPLVPPNGSWGLEGWSLVFTGMFIAAYSTYGFETSVCYVSEFKNPRQDTLKAILSSAILGLAAFTIQPFAFQGFLGESGFARPEIMDGTGVAAAMASMVSDSQVVYYIVYALFLCVVVISLMSAMAGSSRTIYQASKDGWFPKYLSRVNKHGAPVAAMWTDLGYNVILMMLSNYFFILIASNVCYMIFVFLNLNAGWIHRIDSGHLKRPFKAPAWLIALNTVFSFINIAVIGIAAAVLGKGAILSGFIWAIVIIPVFLYRHYITDKGIYPDHMYQDMNIIPGQKLERKAGYLPNLALLGAVFVFIISFLIAK